MTDEELEDLDIQINKDFQAKSLASLLQDEDPMHSANWWIFSDGEDLLLGGTLEECLESAGINPGYIAKAVYLCLEIGCLWIFPGKPGKASIEFDPVKASRKQDLPLYSNFLTIEHSPVHAKLYAEK